jgi:hypothetical protein
MGLIDFFAKNRIRSGLKKGIKFLNEGNYPKAILWLSATLESTMQYVKRGVLRDYAGADEVMTSAAFHMIPACLAIGEKDKAKYGFDFLIPNNMSVEKFEKEFRKLNPHLMALVLNNLPFLTTPAENAPGNPENQAMTGINPAAFATDEKLEASARPLVNEILDRFNQENVSPAQAGMVMLGLIYRLMEVMRDEPEARRVFILTMTNLIHNYLAEEMENSGECVATGKEE